MTDEKDAQLKQLLAVEQPAESRKDRVQAVLARVRAGVAQRDTILFAAVKFWTVIAKLLAPIFAQLAVRKAEFQAGKSKPRKSKSK